MRHPDCELLMCGVRKQLGSIQIHDWAEKKKEVLMDFWSCKKDDWHENKRSKGMHIAACLRVRAYDSPNLF